MRLPALPMPLPAPLHTAAASLPPNSSLKVDAAGRDLPASVPVLRALMGRRLGLWCGEGRRGTPSPVCVEYGIRPAALPEGHCFGVLARWGSSLRFGLGCTCQFRARPPPGGVLTPDPGQCRPVRLQSHSGTIFARILILFLHHRMTMLGSINCGNRAGSFCA